MILHTLVVAELFQIFLPILQAIVGLYLARFNVVPLFTWSSRDTVIRIGLAYGPEDRGITVRFQAEQDMFIFSRVSRPGQRPILPTTQEAKTAILPRVYDVPDIQPTIHST